jgi:hypothetical protein
MGHRRGEATWMPQVVVVLALLWALVPGNPYGYYLVLRWLCFGAFAYCAYVAYSRGNERWVWILATVAVLYNPFFRIHLTRSLWSIINVATIVIALASVVALRSHAERTENGKP